MNFNQSKTPMRTTAISLTLFGLLIAATTSPGIAQQPRPDTAPPVALLNTHTHILHSRVNGRTYLIQVSLPWSYVNSGPGAVVRYPTLYDLDVVRQDFPLLYNQQQYGQAVRPIILVCVTPIELSDPMWWDRDELNYTAPLTAADSQYFKRTGITPPRLGGAPQFLRVLKEEIIPLIDSTYRTSGDRGLEGTSLGGFFVGYAMVEAPELFTRYAMISPSFWYPWGREKGMILAREPEFAKQHPTFQKTVYVNVGSEENSSMLAVAWQFVRQLCNSMSYGNYKGLDLAAETIPRVAHGSPLARMRGVVALYPADSTAPKIGRGVMQDCH
jgi:predicted alpha/beta superfamily hydrolase